MWQAQGLAETELSINTTIVKLGLQTFILEDICPVLYLFGHERHGTRIRRVVGEERAARYGIVLSLPTYQTKARSEIKAWGGLGGEPKSGLWGAAQAASACFSVPKGKAGRGRSCLHASGILWHPAPLKI